MIDFNYLIIDFETGGLNPLKNPITEIGLIAVDANNFKEIARFESFVKGYNNLVYDPRALSSTGITMEQINSGIDVKKMVSVMFDFCRDITPKGDKGKNKPLIVGHNVGFDIGFAKEACLYSGKKLQDIVALTEYGEIDRYDTLRESRNKWKDNGVFKLGACMKRIGIDMVDAHRAMNDCVNTKKLAKYLIIDSQSGTNDKETKQDFKGEKEVDEFRKKFEF